jgi:predicted porin
MKKHLIAAAVAGAFAVPAMAQVTVYGIVDAGYSSTETKVSNGNKTEASTFGAAGQQSGSRLGVRGEEDLGGGMKAGFLYELGVDPTVSTGFADMSNRQAFVSLSGGFGEVRLGRQYTGYFGVNAGYDAGGTVSGAGYLPASNQYGDWVASIRANDVVRYQTPSMNGFTASVAFADDSTKTTSVAGVVSTNVESGGQTLTGQYVAGPLSAMVSWSSAELTTITPASSTTSTTQTVGGVGVVTTVAAVNTKVSQDRLNLGVSYNLGMLSIHLTHNQRENDDKQATNADSDLTDTTIGLKVPVGAATIWASTGEGELKNKGASTGTTDYSAYQLGVSYALSKRTNVYAFMGEDEGKVKSTGVKTTNEGMYFGVRHQF